MPVSEVEENGQKKLIIEKDGAKAEVFLFGATVTKFETASGHSLIWCSKTAKLDGTKAIRGGIPLVFPQFGQPIKEMAQHGFARNNVWSCASKTDDSVTLTLDNTKVTHDAWPFAYKLTFKVSVEAEKLVTSYYVQNIGSDSFPFHCLQHTYLNVGDITGTKVIGLKSNRFLDKTSSDVTSLNFETSESAEISAFTDRVYVGLGGEVKVVCPSKTIVVEGRASYWSTLEASESVPMASDTVVWNPWEANARGMADFDDEGYKEMLCIEPGLVSAFHKLEPGKVMELTQVLGVI